MKSRNSVAGNTVPVTVVPRTFIQAAVVLELMIGRRSVPMRYPTKPWSVTSSASSQFFCPSCISYLISRRWLALDNAPPPVTYQISSALDCWKLRYLSLADITGFRIPNPYLLTGIVLRTPTMGERDYAFTNKRRGKRVSWIILSTPANVSPISQVMRCRNIHSDWIVHITTA